MSKVQDDEVGDGTTSVTVLAAELLRVSVSLSYLKCVTSASPVSYIKSAVLISLQN